MSFGHLFRKNFEVEGAIREYLASLEKVVANVLFSSYSFTNSMLNKGK